MIRGVHHVAVATADLDRLVQFYCDALGFELASRGGWEPGSERIDGIVGLQGSAAKTATLRLSNLYIEMFEYRLPVGQPGDPNRPVNDQGYTHFCLDVVDIDAEYERLVAAGMRFHCAPPTTAQLGSGRLRATYGRDPDGNVIELQEIIAGDYDLPFLG